MSASTLPTSLAIANEFIRRALSNGVPITHMQVQKLVYFAHAFSLASLDRPLISDRFQAWQFGPVAPGLYNALKRYGRDPILREIHAGDDKSIFGDDEGSIIEASLDDEQRQLVDIVFENFGSTPAFKLSALTHEPGSPWEKAFKPGYNRPIEDADLKQHFRQLAPTDT